MTRNAWLQPNPCGVPTRSVGTRDNYQRPVSRLPRLRRAHAERGHEGYRREPRASKGPYLVRN